MLRKRVGAVFIPVRNLRAAAEWYSKLLVLPLLELEEGDELCEIPLEDGSSLLLDARYGPIVSEGPRCGFWSQDIEFSLERLLSLGTMIEGRIEDEGDRYRLRVQDPDGNVLEFWQKKGRKRKSPTSQGRIDL